MAKYAWRIEFDVTASSVELLEEHLENVMRELQKLDTTEPSINAAISGGSVAIGLVTDGEDDFITALRDALMLVRTAVHAAGGTTHDFISDAWQDTGEVRWRQSSLTSELISP